MGLSGVTVLQGSPDIETETPCYVQTCAAIGRIRSRAAILPNKKNKNNAARYRKSRLRYATLLKYGYLHFCFIAKTEK